MKRRDLFLVLSLALSLAALTALEAFSSRIGSTISRDSRNFLAADFRVQAWRPFDDKVLKAVEPESKAGQTALRTDFLATAQAPTGETITVNASAIEGPYPFYGAWRTEPQMSVEDLRAQPLLLADAGLKAKGWAVGQRVRLGQLDFTVAGFVLEEPQTVASAFATGPRLIFHRSWAARTGLLGAGSRAFQQLLVKTALPEAVFRQRFRGFAPDPHWRLITPEGANRQATSVLQRMRGFLSFVLLSGLFLGGVGVFMIFRSRFLLELPQYLTLRCLGMRSGRLLGDAFREAARVSLWAWAPGSLVGLALERGVASYAQSALGVSLSSAQPVAPVLLALAVALALVFLAVLLPLREILRVPVQLAFRQSDARTRGFTPSDAAVTAAVAAAVTWLVARSWRLTVVFLSGLTLTTLALLGISWLLIRLLGQFARARPFVLRQAALSFARQTGSSLLLTVTTGLGIFFLGSVLFLGHALRKQIDFSNRLGVPNLFLIGVAEGDRSELAKLVSPVEFVPVMQARLTEIKGEAVTSASSPDEADSGDAGDGAESQNFYRTREYFITRRRDLAAGERLVAGSEIFGAPRPGVIRASLESRFAESLGVKPGDALKIEIAGVALPAEVRSLRKVDWFNLRPNFFIVLDQDDVAGAPFNDVALTRVPTAQIPDYQKRVVARFPEVTALDGESIARRLLKLLDQLSLSVFSVSLFTLGSCAFVFAGVLIARRGQKLQELALWRCLGVQRGSLNALLALESSAAGLAAALTGLAGAWVTAASICRFFLDIPMETPPGSWIAAALLGVPLLTAAGGWLLLRGLLNQSAVTLFRAAEEV